jgi:hypothetical protein
MIPLPPTTTTQVTQYTNTTQKPNCHSRARRRRLLLRNAQRPPRAAPSDCPVIDRSLLREFAQGLVSAVDLHAHDGRRLAEALWCAHD